MATKCAPRLVGAQRGARRARRNNPCRMFGSSVVPDLLETMKSVRAGSMRRSTRADLRRIGRIQHQQLGMVRAGGRRSAASTSGPRLEPPMPSSSAWVKPSRSAIRRQAPSSSSSRRCWAATMSSQPSQSSSSWPVHSSASRAHRRRTLPSSPPALQRRCRPPVAAAPAAPPAGRRAGRRAARDACAHRAQSLSAARRKAARPPPPARP